jgi:HEPN superfamily Swt1-like protein
MSIEDEFDRHNRLLSELERLVGNPTANLGVDTVSQAIAQAQTTETHDILKRYAEEADAAANLRATPEYQSAISQLTEMAGTGLPDPYALQGIDARAAYDALGGGSVATALAAARGYDLTSIGRSIAEQETAIARLQAVESELGNIAAAHAEARQALDGYIGGYIGNAADFASLNRHFTLDPSISSMISEAVSSTDLAAIREQLDHNIRAIHEASLPSSTEISAASKALANVVEPLHGFDPGLAAGWDQHLAHQFSVFDSNWALEDHLDTSLYGFARLSRLSHTVQHLRPFEAETQALVTEEFGEPVSVSTDTRIEAREVAAVEAGFEAELIAFDRDGYPKVITAAGFRIAIGANTVPPEKGALSHDIRCKILIDEVERRLRELILSQLQAAYGDRWMKQRIPADLRNRWLESHETDAVSREKGLHPIYQSEFMDLMKVICCNPQWADIFADIFESKSGFQTSMQRLGPLRNITAHNKPMARHEMLTVYSEATRILRSLGHATIM